MRPQKPKVTVAQRRHGNTRAARLPWFTLPLVVAMICLMLSLFLYHTLPSRYTRSSERQVSSAFHGRHIPDPVTPPRADEIASLPAGVTTITAQTPAAAQAVKLEFLYRCHPDCDTIWLEYASATNPASWHKLPVHHPLLTHLNWLYTRDQNLVIYQRNPQVKGLSQLVSLGQPVIIEAHLASAAAQLQTAPAHYLEHSPSLEQVDYLVTSRLPLPDIGIWHQYQIVLNPQDIARDDLDNFLLRFNTNTALSLARLSATYAPARTSSQ